MVGYTTHYYELYNSLLWVIRPTIMGCKNHPDKTTKSLCFFDKAIACFYHLHNRLRKLI